MTSVKGGEAMARKILIVDDDKNICELLRLYLEKEGYQTAVAFDGRSAMEQFHSFAPDLILLDVMLPYVSGLQVCQQLREISNVPIIMLTARGETDDKVAGLEIGADDYITKPFEIREVLTRMKVLFRRLSPAFEGETDDVVRFPDLQVNRSRYLLTVGGKELSIPAKELELLYYLATNPNRVFTRNQLLDAVWGFDYVGDTRTVDVHVKRLREKLEGVSSAWSLRTVWGVGYKFEVMDSYAEKSV